MKERINKAKERVTDWLARQAKTRYALWILGFLSVMDAILPPAPPDVMLIPMILANRKRWFFLATVVVVGGLIGATIAYLIGAGLFDVVGKRIIDWAGAHEQFATVGNLYANNAFVSLFGAAFTPIPDTVFTIGAGVFKLSFPFFLFAYAVGRIARIYTEAFVVYLYGPAVAKIVYKYFNIISLILIAAVILVLVLI